MVFVETANGDNMAKFALAQGATGNVRSRTLPCLAGRRFHEDR
jgi:uncharacterized protein with GYD domain